MLAENAASVGHNDNGYLSLMLTCIYASKSSPAVALTALSMWASQGVDAGLLKDIKGEMRSLFKDIGEEVIEVDEEEEGKINGEEQATVMQVFNGYAANLHCAI